jgi:AcrR family transcriptional regulator
MIRAAAESRHSALRVCEERAQRALLELCYERGYAQVEVETVCERAGLPREAFDACYASLEECYCDQLDCLRHDFILEVGGAVLAEAGWREQVRAAAHAMYRFLTDDMPRAHYMLVEPLVAGERARLIRDQGIRAMAILIDQGRACLRDPDSISPVTAQAMAGGIYDEMRRLVTLRRSPEEMAAAVPKLMFAVLLPYLGPEVAAEELREPPPGGLDRYNLAPVSKGDGETEAGADLGPLPGGHHGLTREQVAESQRERLLAATAELIAERGFSETPISEIVKRASVANRIFYANFDSKEEAFIAAFDAIVDHLTALVSAAATEEREWPDQIVAALRAGLEFFDREPTLARFCLVAPFTATPTITAHCRDALAAAISFLAEGRAINHNGSELPASTEDSLLGGAVSQLSRSALTGSGSFSDLLPDLAEFVLAPYLGAREARTLASKLTK